MLGTCLNTVDLLIWCHQNLPSTWTVGGEEVAEGEEEQQQQKEEEAIDERSGVKWRWVKQKWL